MVPIIPNEFWVQEQLHSQDISVQWCYFGLDMDGWEVVEDLGDVPSRALVVNQPAELCGLHLLHCLDREMLLGIEMVQDWLREIKLV